MVVSIWLYLLPNTITMKARFIANCPVLICYRKLLFIFIIVSFPALNLNAQRIFLPDSLGTPIKMPEHYRLDQNSVLGIGHKSRYRYIISDTTGYYSVFKKYSRDSLPVIDFTADELHLYIYCPQCQVSCPTDEPCHRNSCNYKSSWIIRKKKK